MRKRYRSKRRAGALQASEAWLVAPLGRPRADPASRLGEGARALPRSTGITIR